MPATCDVDMNTSLVKRCELQVFDLDRNPVLRRRSGHLTLVSGAGEGEVVSKEVGEEERGAQG